MTSIWTTVTVRNYSFDAIDVATAACQESSIVIVVIIIILYPRL